MVGVSGWIISGGSISRGLHRCDESGNHGDEDHGDDAYDGDTGNDFEKGQDHVSKSNTPGVSIISSEAFGGGS